MIDGGVVPSDTHDVFVQGTYVANKRTYHVLIALDDAAVAASPRTSFSITSSLTCLQSK